MTGTTYTLTSDACLFHADCRDALKALPDNSIDSVCTDPPYALVSIVKRFGNTSQNDDNMTGKRAKSGADGMARMARGFMGKTWDTGEVAFDPAFWAEVLRVLKPGGHLVAMGGTRTYHRLACAVEDAGFEVRDMIAWLYGTGFPKSHDVSKGIDRAAGAEREVIGEDPQAARRNKTTSKFSGVYGEINDAVSCPLTAPATDAARQWEGWGTALKPAIEPTVLARKPLSESTVAANVLRWGTGALNIDACRVPGEGEALVRPAVQRHDNDVFGKGLGAGTQIEPTGRWPANCCHDGSAEVIEAFPDTKARGNISPETQGKTTNNIYGKYNKRAVPANPADAGSAARFFYSAKANRADRAGSKHPTIKPVSLIEYFATLITPPGGVILDPFAGSGTTGAAAARGGFRCVLVEREAEYVEDIRRRFASPNLVPDV